jgi:hypothetical protein
MKGNEGKLGSSRIAPASPMISISPNRPCGPRVTTFGHKILPSAPGAILELPNQDTRLRHYSPAS